LVTTGPVADLVKEAEAAVQVMGEGEEAEAIT
jgi:hypothetical protein